MLRTGFPLQLLVPPGLDVCEAIRPVLGCVHTRGRFHWALLAAASRLGTTSDVPPVVLYWRV